MISISDNSNTTGVSMQLFIRFHIYELLISLDKILILLNMAWYNNFQNDNYKEGNSKYSIDFDAY